MSTLVCPTTFEDQFVAHRATQKRAWLFLALAVVTEVLGLTVMQLAATSHAVAGQLVLYAMVGLSYYFLSQATRTISIGVAYAIWEGSGIALITIVSAVIFAQELSWQEFLGLALAIVGIVLVNAGEVEACHPCHDSANGKC